MTTKEMISPSDRVAIIAGERSVTFSQMLQYVSLFASQSATQPSAKTLIISENREGWIYALYATWFRGGVAVPVDAAATPHDVAYIINDCRPEALWTSREKLPLVRQALEEVGGEAAQVQIMLIDDYEHLDPADLPLAHIEYHDDATALICYTSGTTGSPKGVMLSYRNIMANVRSVWKEVHIFDESTRTIVLLPLHHVLPLVGTAVIPLVVGCGVAISPSLSGPDIMDTLQRGEIGIMIGVPRLWQTLYRGIKAKIDAHAITRMLFSICERVGSRRLSRLVFSSVHKKMGGHLKYCVAGGAALDSVTAVGLKTIGLDVLEGYGMTETAPMIAFTRPGDIRPGCVGLAMPSVEVKIVDGELCARGENVMQGYYNRPEETAAIIDADGFVHTGDLATIGPEGHITITGRKKEIIVLSNGKNVNPVEIEDKLGAATDIVGEVAVTEHDDLLTAIIVPKAEWASGKSLDEMEQQLKRELLQPYNSAVAPYKKVMSLVVYQGELPRTRLEKLQRYKLSALLDEIIAHPQGAAEAQPASESLSQASANPEPTPAAPLSSTLRKLCDYVAGEKRVEVHPSDHMETDLAMDSLDVVALQGFVEQNFDVRLTAGQIMSFGTLAALATHLEESGAQLDREVETIDWHKLLTRPTDNLQLPKMAATGVLFTRLCKAFCRNFFSAEAKGLNNIPADGPFILAPNHQSYLDAPLLVSHLSTATLRQTYFYAKRSHVRGPLMRMLARNHNVVVMDMRTLKDSIRVLGQILADRHSLVIFPEGTRTHDGSVGEFKKTFAILALEMGVPVIPVRINGAYEAWPRTRLFPRCRKVTVNYLPALKPAAGESYEDFAERVRQVIIAG